MLIKTIAIVGAGTMGSGIAQVCATSGYTVTLIDVSADALEQARKTIAASVDKLHSKGKLDDSARQRSSDNITTRTDLAAASGADLVIEAATENKALKFKLFADLDRLTRPDVILASNTSSISLTEIAAQTRRPWQVVGIHFMNPVPLIPLVEVIRGLQTGPTTLESALEFTRSLGKTSVESADSPGFISNRVLCPMINEAIFCVMEGIGTPEAIDTVMTLGMNHPMGPLTLADFVGLDVVLDVLDVLYEGFGDPKYR
ncbi:MAG TPA: 3-hydroxyacyl-CoA dehydrogenase NAD-binding domain-containing protein, partial [Aggregatilineales bacterium]|nr:3-hydroxyacyl-CoA dehydrogenase NAD-binding domain-containing protein [Aggregatilineales bacterium]